MNYCGNVDGGRKNIQEVVGCGYKDERIKKLFLD